MLLLYKAYLSVRRVDPYLTISDMIMAELLIKIYFVYQIIIYGTVGTTVSKVPNITSILDLLLYSVLHFIGFSQLKV